MERIPEAEWGAKPREWVTVMRVCAKSDTPEPNLYSCRHRESKDKICPHGWRLCGFFLCRYSPAGKLHDHCVLSRAAHAEYPLPRAAVFALPSALGTAEGGSFFCVVWNYLRRPVSAKPRGVAGHTDPAPRVRWRFATAGRCGHRPLQGASKTGNFSGGQSRPPLQHATENRWVQRKAAGAAGTGILAWKIKITAAGKQP